MDKKTQFSASPYGEKELDYISNAPTFQETARRTGFLACLRALMRANVLYPPWDQRWQFEQAITLTPPLTQYRIRK